MINRIAVAILVGVITWLVCLFGGGLLSTLPIPPIQFVGRFLVTWAYVWIITGMWFTISPWRLRDWINWSTASEQRTRMFSGLRAAFGLFVMALGFTVFK